MSDHPTSLLEKHNSEVTKVPFLITLKIMTAYTTERQRWLDLYIDRSFSDLLPAGCFTKLQQLYDDLLYDVK